jgi:hypothetical protein
MWDGADIVDEVLVKLFLVGSVIVMGGGGEDVEV